MTKKILYIVNSSEYFLSHRSEIAVEVKKQGFEVHVASPKDQFKKELESLGFFHHQINLSRSGKRVLLEIKTVIDLFKVLINIRPDLTHLITIKPVIYGGVLCFLLGIRGVVCAIPGLGYSYISEGIKASIFRFILSFLFRIAFFNKSLKVIFQNKDDINTISKASNLDQKKVVLIKGSGVNLDKFSYKTLPTKGKAIISMASRLQRDKGVIEFFQAAEILKERRHDVEFNFIGSLDSNYASVITENELIKWKRKNVVNFLGHRDDIESLFQKSSIIVLPSYREGFPKVLQEAAACGRAVITSDVPGCRDAIKEGLTGVLVNPKDPFDLAEKIDYLLSNTVILIEMGLEARKFAEKEFSIERVIKKHLEVYQDISR